MMSWPELVANLTRVVFSVEQFKKAVENKWRLWGLISFRVIIEMKVVDGNGF